MRITLVVLSALLLSGCVVVDPYGYRPYSPYHYRVAPPAYYHYYH